jgi:hypothetical protein
MQASKARARILRHEFTEQQWTAINPMLPNKPCGVPRVNDRRVLNGIFWVLTSGAPWRDLPELLAFVRLASIRLWLSVTSSRPSQAASMLGVFQTTVQK